MEDSMAGGVKNKERLGAAKMARELRASGLSSAVVARCLGVSLSTVWRMTRGINARRVVADQRPAANAKRRKVTSEVYEKAVRLRAMGKTVDEVCAMLGLGRRTYYDWVGREQKAA